MSIQMDEVVLLDDSNVCSAQELLDVSGLSPQELGLLLENGLIAPVAPAVEPPRFYVQYLVLVQTARRLRDDFELDGPGMLLALTLLQRIRDIEGELRTAHARLSRVAGTPA